MKLKTLYSGAILLFVMLFSANAFAAWSFNLSADNYTLGDSQVVFDLKLITDETLTMYNYTTEFNFDNTELSFVTHTNTPVAGMSFDSMGKYQFNVDQSTGQINAFYGDASRGVEVSAGNYQLGSFTFDVIAGVLDGETDFNFNYASGMSGFDFDSGWFTLSDKAVSFSADIAPAGSPVPVPAAVWLLGSGIAGLACFRRKQA